MKRSNLVECTDASFVDMAVAAGVELPLEQTPAWDRFDLAAAGRSPWRKLVWKVDGTPRAFIALTKMRGRGFTYLWAKHGPVWTSPQPTSVEEAALRKDVTRLVNGIDKRIAFVRLHAIEPAEDLHELLQSVTYDRTVIIDTSQNDEAILASMKSRGRRDVRKALRNDSMVVADETDHALDVFPELYDVLVETADRDHFGIAPLETYLSMLGSLGPEHCRLYTVRRDGRPLCWGIVTLTATQGTYYYAASTHEGRKSGAPDLLVYAMACSMHALGRTSFDLMGIDSARAPQLAGVRDFKKKFRDEVTDVPGAWDVPTRPALYSGLKKALHAKRSIRAGLKDLRTKEAE